MNGVILVLYRLASARVRGEGERGTERSDEVEEDGLRKRDGRCEG